MTPEEFRIRAQRLSIDLPDDAVLRFVPQTRDTMQMTLFTPQSQAYRQCAGCIDLLPRRLDDPEIRRIASRVRLWDRQWKEAMTVDALIALTVNGHHHVQIGLDRPFVLLLERSNVSIDDFLVGLRRAVIRGAYHGDIMTNLKVGVTNWDRDCLRAHGFRLYPNMFDAYCSAFPRMPHFQGSCLGRKPLAFDFLLGEARYVSSRQPTLTARLSIPDATLNSLRGRRMNDIVSGGLFGEDQTVIRAWRSGKSHVSMTMTQEIVPITSAALPIAA